MSGTASGHDTKRSFDQKRARHALDCVNEARGKGEFDRYRQSAKGLPVAILINGLGQALAAEYASGDKGRKFLANHLACWLLDAGGTSPYREQAGKEEGDAAVRLLNCVVKQDQHAYLWAQREALVWLKWLKLFATAADSSGTETPDDADGKRAAGDG
ncbi:MAG: hypothetical protein KatS3mg119_1933 [Rhodothalassiaceae bacterium]|nr:MAG: hypothetical protein KatS3mg119_1933 [Rhodothalassiaceae bacterium]